MTYLGLTYSNPFLLLREGITAAGAVETPYYCHTPLQSAERLSPQTLSCCLQSKHSPTNLAGITGPKQTCVPANIARLNHQDK